MPSVLVILAEGFEEIEAITPIDVLRRAGAEVTVASLTATLPVKGRNGLAVHADCPLVDVISHGFDVILLPGGPGVKHLRANPLVIPRVQRQHNTGGWVAAICAAPTVLLDAGLLEGRRYTAHFSVEKELPRLLANERVVVDGSLITSRGAGTAMEFGLTLVEKLFSADKAREVAASICL